MGPLVRKLLVRGAPGAGLTGARKPVRLSGLVSFRGEKRTLTAKDVRRLAATLVERSVAGPGEPPFPADETEALTDALATTLLALGDLDMDDVQAVSLGAPSLARALRTAAPAPDGLSTDSVLFLDSLTEWACVQILEFFTQRSTFVARSLVEQTRGQAELTAKVDEVIRRTPRLDARDAAFERRYLAYVAKKHGSLTIYGVDLRDSPEKWPLDVAYLSLEATGTFSDLMAAKGWALLAEIENACVLMDPGSPEEGALLRQRNEAHHALTYAGGRADQALAQEDKVLLRGLAGSGKTTLVQWLAVSATRADLADDMAYLRNRIPFVLPLRTLTRHGERLPAPDRFLAAVGCPLSPPEGWADRVLAAGRGLVLIDGIDEIPEAERERARRWLRDLLDSYGGNRWLVTSRPTAVRDDWLASDGFTELTLAPMSTAEVATFVRRWHRAAGPEAAPYEQPLLDALRTTSEVAQLATNPLMCGLICALHRNRRGFLPRGRKALYDAALSMLLTRRDRERDMATPYGIELGEAPQIQLIQRIAYWLTLNGRTTMDRSHAESVVREAVPAITEAAGYDPGAVFTHLLHRSGLLREPTEETVDFVHRTFQDYLAAKALVDRWVLSETIGSAKSLQTRGSLVRVLESLPVDNELELLTLVDYPEGGFGVLRHLTGLRELTLGSVPALTPEDWRVLTSLGMLTVLSMSDVAMWDMPRSVRLPVKTLHVDCQRASAPLAVIGRAFPELEHLLLWGFPDPQAHDLSPLASLQRLNYVYAGGARFTGTEHLSPTVELRT